MRGNCCDPDGKAVAEEKSLSESEPLPSLPLNVEKEHINSITESDEPTEDRLEKFSNPNETGISSTEDARESLVHSSDADYIIYFGENSSIWLDDKAVSTYLNQLEQRVKKSKEKIIITAYDDDIAAPSESFAMTKRRAWRVRKAFKDDFVRRQHVIMKSEGQENPVAPNDNEEGRAKNRRVEIKIVKD